MPESGRGAYRDPAAADHVGLLAALDIAAGGADAAVAVRVPVGVLAFADAALAAPAALVAALLVIRVQQASAVLACMHARQCQSAGKLTMHVVQQGILQQASE